MLVRLLYASRAISPSQEALEAILVQARQNNAALGITGVLCCGADVYLQAIEGSRSAVSRLFGQVQADPRHRHVELLQFEEIEQRRFAGWSMGKVDLARLNQAVLLKYSDTAEFNPFALSGRVSLALLEELMVTAAVMGRA